MYSQKMYSRILKPKADTCMYFPEYIHLSRSLKKYLNTYSLTEVYLLNEKKMQKCISQVQQICLWSGIQIHFFVFVLLNNIIDFFVFDLLNDRKNTLHNNRIRSEIAETFKTTLTAQTAKNQQKYKIHFSAYSSFSI